MLAETLTSLLPPPGGEGGAGVLRALDRAALGVGDAAAVEGGFALDAGRDVGTAGQHRCAFPVVGALHRGLGGGRGGGGVGRAGDGVDPRPRRLGPHDLRQPGVGRDPGDLHAEGRARRPAPARGAGAAKQAGRAALVLQGVRELARKRPGVRRRCQPAALVREILARLEQDMRARGLDCQTLFDRLHELSHPYAELDRSWRGRPPDEIKSLREIHLRPDRASNARLSFSANASPMPTRSSTRETTASWR